MCQKNTGKETDSPEHRPSQSLVGMTRDEMEQFAMSCGEKPFRGRQLYSWIYARGAEAFCEMTDLSRDLRDKFQLIVKIDSLVLVERVKSKKGNTDKFLFSTYDGHLIESVAMYYDEQRDGRCTACISSQAGCARGCAFCDSGRLGLARNLTIGEIVNQVVFMQRILRREGRRIHNVVVMGIGEPFDNYENFTGAVRLLNEPNGIAIGMRRLAVSTVGIPQYIRRFAHEGLDMRFAVSLHAPDNETRNRIMPVNRRHPVEELLDACRYYQSITGNRITMEYILIAGVNDSQKQAQALGNLLQGLHVLVNLIPLNPVESFPHRRPSPRQRTRFKEEVEKFGHKAALRNERGVDIAGACGQLRFSRI